jgi:hypothetical protein
MNQIKNLPEQFVGRGEVRGFEFIQISKTNRGFCYEVSSNGIITHYEVFRRKINKRFNCESYPTAKSFGLWAWTYRTKEEALNKLNLL